jgi:uncharacterized protein
LLIKTKKMKRSIKLKINNRMKKKLLFVLLFVAVCLSAQIPQKPVPPRLVNDFAGLFTASERAEMENMLVAFNDSTSNQITVVTVEDLYGYSAQQFAYEIGEQWGVGSKKYNNGIVIVLKPRNKNGDGEVNISTGYGLEGAIPDAVCKRIIDEEMIRLYANGDYYNGTLKGVETLMKLAAGEISAADYNKTDWTSILFVIAVFVGFIILVKIINTRKHPPHNGAGGKVTGGVIGGGMGGSSWGSSGGRGSFGGFGGGSFGGGGASGRF